MDKVKGAAMDASKDVVGKYFIYKQVFALSMLFFFACTALNPLLALQSSFNQNDGLGFATLSAWKGSLGFASLFIPSILLNAIGRRYSMALSLVGFILFVLANLYSKWWTLIPSASFVGICESLLWCAGPVYIKELSTQHANLYNESMEKVFSKVYPVFYGISKLSHIIGNIISSSVLHISGQIHTNTTINTICGALYCPSMELPPQHLNITRNQVITLVGICLGCTAIALLIALLCISREENSEKDTQEEENDSIFSTIREMKDFRMLLLAPITLFSGVQASFLVGEFNEAYVTCFLGIDVIGWIMISYGSLSFLSSVIFGYIGKWIRPLNILISVMICHIALLTWLLEWGVMETDSLYPYLLAAGIYGACDCAWRSLTVVIVGHTFSSQQKEVFSLREFWESIGQMISFGLGHYICIRTKIFGLIGLMLVGMSLLGIVEYRNTKSKEGWERLSTEE